MKSIILAGAMLAAATTAVAQTASYQLNVLLHNGQSINVSLDDVQKITFTEIEAPTPEATDFSIAIPTDWSASSVMKVMNGTQQVAEICREYVKAANAQMVVVYPMGADGKADLTKGVTTGGQTVAWDATANTATIGGTAAETEYATLYVVDGEIVTSTSADVAAATVTPDLLVDQRGAEVISYPIVKVGTQYWMAANLRATKYADGTDITSYSDTQTDLWKADATGCYLADADADWVSFAGYYYSGYCVTNEHGIAPEGWEVPTYAQAMKLRTAGNLLMANYKDNAAGAWSSGTATNLTGFSAVGAGYYNYNSGTAGEGTEAYFWTSTKYYDAMSRADNLDTIRLTATGTNMVISSSALGGHVLTFGHSLRCVRK